MSKNPKSVLSNLDSRLATIAGMPALIQEEYDVLIEEEKAAEQVATLIRQTRESAGLSQTELGRKVGVSQARISQMERGDATFGPSIGLLVRVAQACGCTLMLSFGRLQTSHSAPMVQHR